MASYSKHIRLNGMSSEHGLCSIIAPDRDHVRCARRAKGVLHTLGDAGIIAEQDAREERSLRFGESLRDDILGARLESEQPSERRKTLIACQHAHA